jgi:hypothetical protein
VTGRRASAAFLAAFLGLLVVAVARATLVHHRVVGRGQIRFDGAGPERWAARFRREHRLVVGLRRRLAGRVSRLVYLVDAFECIHGYEGGWGANTGNGYYGGLQMDIPFQRTYGRELLSVKGTADRWAPSEQIAVAIAAEASRGWSPWPETARRCGLIR